MARLYISGDEAKSLLKNNTGLMWNSTMASSLKTLNPGDCSL